MTDEEVTEFYRLLQMYAEEIDQFELRKFPTPYGTMYFTLSMQPLTGEDHNYESMY